MMRHIVITPGEPSGIGPDIVLQIAQQSWDACITVIADPTMLMERTAQLSLSLQIAEVSAVTPLTPHVPGTLRVLPVRTRTTVIPGVLLPENSPYVLETLAIAAMLCKRKHADAIVTGPVHKGIMNNAGISFTGHTEFFAQQANVAHTIMLFVVGNLRVALATTHLALKDVPSAITPGLLNQTLTILHQSLQQLFNITSPKILVCGLNPHAGEGGYLGMEEINVIEPTVRALKLSGMDVVGPLAADTLFTTKNLLNTDAVLAMYHDQALPLIKYIGFGNAVNVTLGLPFVRTSVDHGTALDMAGTGNADAGSMEAAIQLAIRLASVQPSSND